ncbi:Fur family transcriptional regulator, ferric uptake regulator [Chryseobacterium soldanellicola]|uniref:Fur family transcriptional regulator, ferric uptake regulator n=1 Tax=Chryseobacterium soldanellicola TaxID=311333 RepID=A0A1H1FKB1_9FLAO|nr:transcriptional repressor [Chryseobacterium soldanellicola]SDR00896.1 Fur family transcriptional regulator, ferric uptake regulator [Chryseobacterium soldanellicola]
MRQSRSTHSKTEIFRIISDSDTALSHADIQAKLDGLCNRVTIYRVLERLEEEGKIHKIVNVDGVVNFAICKGCTEVHHHNHLHFNFEKCKSVICLEKFVPEIELPENFSVNQFNFVVSGLCDKCSVKY